MKRFALRETVVGLSLLASLPALAAGVHQHGLAGGQGQLMRVLVGLQQGHHLHLVAIEAAQHLGQRLHTGHPG